MIRIVSVLLMLAVVGGALTEWLEGGGALLNFEAGFWSASLVLAASTFGYWQMVADSGVSVPHHDLPDIVEQIDDRYGLWEEEPDRVPHDVKTLMQEEKARLKRSRRSFREFLKTTKPALSLYRLAAYAVLAAGVVSLISNELFQPLFYLLGAALAPFATAVLLWADRR
ncbi:hypothetical protein [Hydrogenimonas cancrithermarum]|uniref:Integral membrane protein n=1 Tax=Hydrogenimonas cancrithermarum TaxID=2993563 RepID=A0ABM8FPM4_9BACT|nr:hypothetical protein [Hydrogenimonas cancrithermarum]BDY13965.1 hypothetical protein HCR_22770 [Hydrogenimonas cancrithermarum]